MVKGVFDELSKPKSKNHFTIGINDDISHTSVEYDTSFTVEPPEVVRAIFYGVRERIRKRRQLKEGT